MEGTSEQINQNPLLADSEGAVALSGKKNSRDRQANASGQNEQDAADSSEGNHAEVVQPKKTSKPTPRTPAVVVRPRSKVDVSLPQLLQAGVHYGHQTSRWNPAMAKYIYTARNGIHILHLPKTVQLWKQARQAIVDVVSNGGSVLFVGTKKRAQDPVMEEATRCGAFYVSQRWLGGMITNFQTIRKSIDRMHKIEQILHDEEHAITSGGQVRYTKKERLMMSKELEKLVFSLGGIREMQTPPQMIFVIDIKREEIAVREARKLDIPVVALVDTNCEPDMVDYAIPSNDDGTRAIRFFCEAVADAVMEGKELNAERLRRMPAEAKKEAARAKRAAAQKETVVAEEEAPVAEATEEPSSSEA